MNSPIRHFKKMPGIPALEDRLMMDTHAGDKDLHGFKRLCNETLFDLFGITHAETLFQYPASYLNKTMSADDREDIEDAAREHEENFVTEAMFDEDRAEYLKNFGWDLYGNNGQPLLITRHVCRVIEAVAKGIAGIAPEADVVDTKRWAEDMQRQADQFKRKRKQRDAS
jgi:hypothetical protein